MALDLTDYSSNSNDLTNVGVSESSDTPFAASTSSALFEGANLDYLYITDANQTGLEFSGGKFTFECWVKLAADITHNAEMLFNKTIFDSWASNATYTVFIDNYWTPKTTFRIHVFKDDSNWNYRNYATPIERNTWVHLAVTCDTSQAHATMFEFFVNGSSVGNGVAAGGAGACNAIRDLANPVQIGNMLNAGTPQDDYNLDGLLDEVRAWNDIRTSTEISDNYNKRLAGTETGLVAYYPFEPLEPPAVFGNMVASMSFPGTLKTV
jgi:hypothetical protein